MTKIQVHDIVISKATPNSGEMVVIDIKNDYRNFPYATSENPVVFVKFWDDKKKEYNFDSFYSNHLIKVDKE
jgi:hypothetical protein